MHERRAQATPTSRFTEFTSGIPTIRLISVANKLEFRRATRLGSPLDLLGSDLASHREGVGDKWRITLWPTWEQELANVGQKIRAGKGVLGIKDRFPMVWSHVMNAASGIICETARLICTKPCCRPSVRFCLVPKWIWLCNARQQSLNGQM